MTSERSLTDIAFSAGAATQQLPSTHVHKLHALLPHRITRVELTALLNSLRLSHPSLVDALFLYATLPTASSLSRSAFVTAYAVLRALALSDGHHATVCAQDAVWLAFRAAAGHDADLVTFAEWRALASALGRAVGGPQSLPCETSVARLRRAWRRVRLPIRHSLSFHRLLAVLRLYDAGLVQCLRALGFVLASAVARSVADARQHFPVWLPRSHDSLFLSPFLSDTIQRYAAKSQPAAAPRPGDIIKTQSESSGDPPPTSSSPEPTLAADGTNPTSSDADDDNAPTAAIPHPLQQKPVRVVRRTANTRGKTPFHIDFSSLELGERIGSGGYGDVYRGTFLMSPVAVKMFHVNISPKLETNRTDSENASQLNRMTTIAALKRFASANSQEKYLNFVREVEMMSVVRHPNLVLYMGACGDPVTPLCIVSELFTGGSLHDYLHERNEFRPSAHVATSFALNIARGMFYLHSSQPSILHRDLKARNVLLSGRGGAAKGADDEAPHVVICDFGLCKLFGEDGNSRSQMGTALYMSPDAITCDGYEAADDVYSYGILLYEMFTGRVPYAGMRTLQVMYRVAHEALRPEWDETDLAVVCDDVRALIEQCWDADRRKRPGFDEIIGRLTDIEAALSR